MDAISAWTPLADKIDGADPPLGLLDAALEERTERLREAIMMLGMELAGLNPGWNYERLLELLGETKEGNL